MEVKDKPKFPQGFFSQHRPTVSTKEALKNVEPVKWTKDVSEGKKMALLKSKDEKNIIANFK